MAKKKKESFEEYKKRTQKESIKTNTGEKESFESFMKKRQKNMSTEYGAYMDRADILKSIAEGRKNSIDKDKAYSNESWNRYYNRQVDEVMEKGKEAKKSFGYSKKTKGYRDSIDKTNSSLKDTSIQLKNRSDIEAKELEEKQNKEIAGNIAENAYDIAMKKVFGFNRDTLREEQERKDAQARKDAMDKLRGKSQTQTFVNDKYAGQGLRSLMEKMDNESKRRQEMRNNIYSATENEEKNWSVEDTSKKIKELEQKREEKAEERWKIEKGKEYGMSDDDNRSDDLQYEMNYIDDEINRLNQIKSEKHNEKMSNALNEVSKEGNKLIEEVGKQDVGEEFIENGLSDEDKAVLQKHGVSLKEAKEWKTEQYYAKEDAIRESAIKGATEEHPVLMSIASVGAGMVSPMQDIPEVLNAKMNDRGIDVSRMSLSNSRDDVRDTASDMTGSEVGRFLYQTGMSMADFLAAAPTGNAATFIMGSTAGVSALKDAKERGVSDDKAILTGIASGVAEGFFEKFSLENLKALQATGKSGLKNMVKDVAKQSFTEGSEEFFTDISNAITDGLINGGLSEYETNVKAYMLSGMSEQEARMQASKNFAKQLGMSFAGGAISGGVMGAGKVGLNSLSEYKSIGKDIKEKGEVESLLDTAAGIDGTLDTEKVNVQSDKEIGKLAKKTIENIETQLSDASSQEELDKTYEVLVEKTKNPTIQSELAPMYEMAKRRISESGVGNLSESVETMNNTGVDLRQMAQEVADRQIESRRAERGVQRNGMENMTSTIRGVSNSQNTADESRSMTNSAQNQFNEQSVENSQKFKYGQNTESNIMLSQNTNTAAVNLDTGAPAVVERFTNVGREDATVQLSDGSEMPLSNLTMQDRRTQQVMNAAAALDSTPAANVFVEDYRSDVPIATYTEACYRLYNAGRAGVTNTDMVIRQIAGGTNVPKATLLKMHAIGLNQMKAEKAAETKTNVTRRAQGNVVDNWEDVGDSDILKRVAKKIAEKTGQDVNLEKVLEQDDNGTYKAGQGMISISENANNAIATIIHETQEFAYENNREGMDKFIDTFLDYMAEEKGYAEVERMLQAYHSTYSKVEGDITIRQAAKEMVFDAAGGLFADDKGIENFTSWLNENEDMSTEQKKSVLQSLADFFRDMIDKMKEYMKNHRLNHAASVAMEMEIETKEKLREQLMEAIDKAGENYKTEQEQQEDVATSQEEREQVNEKKGFSPEVITDVNDEKYYTYDNLIKLGDMEVPVYKLERIKKEETRTDIQKRSFRNIKRSKDGKEVEDKIYIRNKSLGDILVTKNSIRHILIKMSEQRGILALNIDKYLPNSIVINKTNFGRNGAEKSYILLGMLREKENEYVVRTVVNLFKGNLEINDVNTIYAVATKKNQPVFFNQGLGNDPIPSTGSDKISIKDLLDIVKKYFPNESPKDVAEKLGYERGKSDIEGLRHSIEVTVPTKDIVAENKHLQEMVQFLKEEFAITGGTQPSRSQVESVSKKILRDTGSNYDKETLTNNLCKLYEYLHSEDANQGEGLKIASEIARGVLEESVLKDTTMYDTYQPMREYFEKTKIKLSEAQKEEVSQLYGSYGAFRKQNMGRLNLSEDGKSLDEIYGELSNMYPEFFTYGTEEGEQPFALVDALDAIQPQIRSANQEDMDTYAYELAGTIFKEISDVQARETFADKKEKEKREALAKLSKKYEKKVEELKKQAKDTYHANMKQESESYQRANIETQRRLQEQIKELEISLKGAGPEVVQDLKIEIKKKNEQIRALRENYSIQIANMKAKMTHSQKMRRQNMQRTEFKNSIRKNCRRLNRLLVKPTDKNHVPEPLQKPLMEFVAGIDLIDDNESKSSMKYMDIVNCMRDIRDKLDNYEKGKQSDEWEKYYIEVDPDYVEMLGQSIKDMEATVRISDMTLEQLANLDLVVKGAAKMVSTVNTMFENGKYENIEALGKASISELEEHKSKKGDIPFLRSIDKMLNTEMLTPREFFETLGDSATSIYDEIRQGFNRRVWDIKKAQEFMEKETKDVDMKKITQKVHTFTVGSQKFKMTTGQLMELYCLSKRKQALGHIVSGGIKINEFSEKGKLRKNKKSEVINMKEASLQRILSELSPEEKALADHMQEFLSTECSDWGNDVSMKMYGYRKFTEKNYYPIKSESNQTPTNESNKSVGEQSGFYRIKNQGMTKATTEGANNTIVISDIFDTFTQHVTNMASYHAYCVPLSDAMRWYNYRYTEKDEEGFVKSHSIKEEMERVYGKKAKDYFEQLLLDINGESSRDNRAEISDKMLANWKVASVAGNMRVVIQQPTAYIRAANVMNPKYMSKAVTMKPAIKESQEKSAIAQWKAWGYYDTMIGKSMKEVITGESSIADTIRDKTTILAGKADDMTWGVIYNAVKLEIKDTRPDLKEGTVEFDEAVARRYDDVIDKTQVVDSVLNKPGYMRSKNVFHRLTGSFMAEPMLTYNMMRKSLVDVYYKKPEALEKLGRTAAVFGVQCVVNAAAQSIIDAIRSDDDDDYWKKWVNALSGNILDNANPLSMIPYAKDIVSMIQGYELKRSDMEGISLLVNSITEIVKEPEIISDIFTGEAFKEKKKYRKFKNIINGLSKTTGLPLYNLYRDMVEPVMKLANGGPLVSGSSSGDVYEDYYDSIAGEGAYEKKKESEEKETSGNTSLHIAQLMEAIRENDDEKEKELRKKLAEEGNTEQDVTKKLRTALGKADPRIEEAAKYRIRGNTSAYVKVANEIIADGFSHSLVMESINNKINSLKSKSSADEKEDSMIGEKDANEENGKVVGWYTNMDIVSALDNGQETGEIIDDIVSTQKENGKTDKQIEQSIRSSLSSAYREKYKEGDDSVKQDIIKKLTGITVNGKQIFLQGTGSIFDRWNKETKK